MESSNQKKKPQNHKHQSVLFLGSFGGLQLVIFQVSSKLETQTVLKDGWINVFHCLNGVAFSKCSDSHFLEPQGLCLLVEGRSSTTIHVWAARKLQLWWPLEWRGCWSIFFWGTWKFILDSHCKNNLTWSSIQMLQSLIENRFLHVRV